MDKNMWNHPKVKSKELYCKIFIIAPNLIIPKLITANHLKWLTF